MLERSTDRLVDFAPTILRVMAGITFFLHGWAKIGNPAGFAGFVGSLGFPLPNVFAWIVILLETLGGLLLIIGLGVRPVSLLLALEMLITTIVVKSRVGFIAPGGQPGVGAELDLMLLAASLTLSILGAGALSVERSLLGWGRPERRSAAIGR